MFSRDHLPGNIHFHHQNFLEPFPEEFLGKYDIVNVRVMVLALSSDEWGPAVRNLMTLLREYNAYLEIYCLVDNPLGPGGYLQWVDCAAHDCVVKGPDGVNPTHARRYMEIFRTGMIAVGKTPK
jgi:hypothetical protein